MCGRFVLTSPPDAIARLFGYSERPNFPPRANIAPTQPIAVVVYDDERSQSNPGFSLMRWGFLPAWVKDPRDFPLLINARAETAREKPAFKSAMKYRRCLIPADGFYEWLRDGKDKFPYFAKSKQGPLAFAGLWERWLGADGSEIDTVAFLTVDANAVISSIHHRMPAVIAPEDFQTWLDHRASRPNVAHALLKPANEDVFDLYPVSQKVNKAASQGMHLMDPLTSRPKDTPPQLDLF